MSARCLAPWGHVVDYVGLGDSHGARDGLTLSLSSLSCFKPGAKMKLQAMGGEECNFGKRPVATRRYIYKSRAA